MDTNDRLLDALVTIDNITDSQLRAFKPKIGGILQKLQRRLEIFPGGQHAQRFASTSQGSLAGKKARDNDTADRVAGGLSAEFKRAHSSFDPEPRSGAAARGDGPIGKPVVLPKPVAVENVNLPARYASPSFLAGDDHAPKDTSASRRLNLALSASEVEDIKRSVLALDPETTRLKQQLSNTDARIVDLLIADGSHVKEKSYKEIQLRRILSQRSLAAEYDSWDRVQSGGTSSLDRRVTARREDNSLKLARTKQPSAFIAPRFSESHHETIKKVIKAGTKLLYFEQALGGKRFFPIIIFRYSNWYRLKYTDMQALADNFRSQPLLEHTEKSWKGWSECWDRKYDGQSSGIFPAILTWTQRGTKARRHPNVLSNHCLRILISAYNLGLYRIDHTWNVDAFLRQH
ncbi:MAG: hypothetical protein Q9185_001484 [Variospora sp. 1 TL-2023]